MKVLVIGGTYFLGKSYVEQLVDEKWSRAKTEDKIEIYLLNRGSKGKPDGVDKVYKLDRHEARGRKGMELRGESFDVIVDFCAYREGDIASLVNDLSLSFDQYIFISTCDVYERFSNEELDETAPLEKREFSGEEGEYISGKVRLEEELRTVCEEKGAAYTSIRPAFIYGPGNYAPREGIYFNWLNNAGEILQPFDATGYFQLVYVEDVARAIFLTTGNRAAYNQAYNVCGTQLDTYSSFFKALQKAVRPKKVRCVYMTVAEIEKKHISLPFPLTEEESENYLGEKIQELGLNYIKLEDGLEKSYRSYEKEALQQATYVKPPKLILK